MLAAPIYQVNALMGTNLIIVVFAVVVIGGMGSIVGSIVSGFALGLLEGLTKTFFPQASNLVIFVIMAIVLLVKPAGLFGTAPSLISQTAAPCDPVDPARRFGDARGLSLVVFWAMTALLIVAPFVFYPSFLMKALCFALFALALQPSDRLPRSRLVRPRDVPRHRRLHHRLRRQGLGLDAGTRDPRRHARLDRARLVVGLLSVRRQKIYFAMITLALGELVYFFFLQAPFSGGEDGLRRCRAATCSA